MKFDFLPSLLLRLRSRLSFAAGDLDRFRDFFLCFFFFFLLSLSRDLDLDRLSLLLFLSRDLDLDRLLSLLSLPLDDVVVVVASTVFSSSVILYPLSLSLSIPLIDTF